MGYTTNFSGKIRVEPPLNEAEAAYLRRFARSRRMHREQGPYRAEPWASLGQDDRAGVTGFSSPPPEQPNLWCQWIPSDDGSAIEWDEGENFYEAEKWMAYLISTFLMPGAALQAELADPVPGREYPPFFALFTFGHVCSGVIAAQGEEAEDRWDLVVRDNAVSVRTYSFRPDDETGEILA